MERITISLNSDKEFVKTIKEKLKANDGYCPCRLKKDSDTKCMCKEFRQMIENKESGFCHCGLYEITVEDKS